jgi:hypothetical protein
MRVKAIYGVLILYVALRYNPEFLGFVFLIEIMLFFIDVTIPAALWLGLDPAFNINEYHNIFWGVKASGTYG